jgi:hypothetical protein
MKRPGFYEVECRCRRMEWDSAKGAGVILLCLRCHVRNFIPPATSYVMSKGTTPVAISYPTIEIR